MSKISKSELKINKDYFYANLVLNRFGYDKKTLWEVILSDGVPGYYTENTTYISMAAMDILIELEKNKHPNILYAVYNRRNNSIVYVDMYHYKKFDFIFKPNIIESIKEFMFDSHIRNRPLDISLIDLTKKYTVLIGMEMHMMQYESEQKNFIKAIHKDLVLDSLLENNNVNNIIYVSR